MNAIMILFSGDLDYYLLGSIWKNGFHLLALSTLKKKRQSNDGLLSLHQEEDGDTGESIARYSSFCKGQLKKPWPT